MPSTLVKTKDIVINPLEKARVAFKFSTGKPYIKLILPPKIADELRNLCARSETEILIASPYIRKTSLSYVLSDVSDNIKISVIPGTRPSYMEAKKAEKKRIFVSEPYGRIHSKIIISDNEVGIGSANITESGLRKSYEVILITNDLDIIRAARYFLYGVLGKAKYESYYEPYYGGMRSLSTATQSVFVSSLKNLPLLLLDLAKNAQRNIIFTSPTYKYESMKMLLDHINFDVNIEAFIKINERDWIRRGVSDPLAISLLLERGAVVWNVQNIHAKIFIVDEKIAVISSLNITDESFNYIFDAGILTMNSSIIDDLIKSIDKLRRKKIVAKDFNALLADFYKKAPFVMARIMQKEGDQFADEEEQKMKETEEIEFPVHKYPEHTGKSLKLPAPPQPLDHIRKSFKKVRPADSLPEGEVLIGHKKVVDYFKSCCFLFLIEKKTSVVVKARGRFISKAVDLARIFKPTTTIRIANIKTGTVMFGFKGKIKPVSYIEITLSKVEDND